MQTALARSVPASILEHDATREFARRIEQINLDPIKIKLMSMKGGENWSRCQADCIEIEYRRFLLLLALYPDDKIVPSEVVDTFWHYHILDTEKYAADCEATFGHFVHHFPYFGIRGDQDAMNLQLSFAHSNDRYVELFGARSASGASAANCDQGGSGGDCYGKCGKIENETRPSFETAFSPSKFI